MKLYSKEAKLMDYSAALNDKSFWIDGNSGYLIQELDYAIIMGARNLRRQAFLDIEILGKNYINKPFILKRNRDDR